MTRFIFLLEELEAPYTVRTVTTRTRDGGSAVVNIAALEKAHAGTS